IRSLGRAGGQELAAGQRLHIRKIADHAGELHDAIAAKQRVKLPRAEQLPPLERLDDRATPPPRKKRTRAGKQSMKHRVLPPREVRCWGKCSVGGMGWERYFSR